MEMRKTNFDVYWKGIIGRTIDVKYCWSLDNVLEMIKMLHSLIQKNNVYCQLYEQTSCFDGYRIHHTNNVSIIKLCLLCLIMPALELCVQKLNIKTINFQSIPKYCVFVFFGVVVVLCTVPYVANFSGLSIVDYTLWYSL